MKNENYLTFITTIKHLYICQCGMIFMNFDALNFIYKRTNGKRVAICGFRFSVLDFCLDPISQPLAASIRSAFFPFFPFLSSIVFTSSLFFPSFSNCCWQFQFIVHAIATVCFDMLLEFFRISYSPLHSTCFVLNCSFLVSHLH